MKTRRIGIEGNVFKNVMSGGTLPRVPRPAGMLLLALGYSPLVAGCDHDARPNRLDVAETVSASNAEEWVRKNELLRVKTTDTLGKTVESQTTVAEVIYNVEYACSPSNGDGSCYSRWNQEVKTNLCTAKTLLALSTPQSDPVVVRRYVVGQTKPVVYAFDQITEANSADFAGFAVDYARSALNYALNQLESPATECSDGGVWEGGWDQGSAAITFANDAVGAYFTARSAYDRLIEATINVADSARSSTTSPSEAGELSLLASKYSRSAAAHYLVGGDAGLLGSQTAGYCSTPLSVNGTAALRLLRDAAPSPDAISDNTTIQDLLNSTTVVTGSVRKRLAALHKINVLGFNPATGLANGTPSQKVEEYYGLDESDFVQARQYLKQEIAVFNRTKTTLLGPAVNGIQRYAGTAGLTVPALPPGAWTAQARYMGGPSSPWYNVVGYWPMAPNGDTPEVVAPYRTPPLETFIGEAHARILTLTAKNQDTFADFPAAPGTVTSARKAVLGLLGTVTMSREYLGAIEALATISTNKLQLTAHGIPLADKVRVVVGEDGLRCAVQGNIEGVDCKDSGAATVKFATGNTTCTTKPHSLGCLTIAIPTTPNPANSTTYFGTSFYFTVIRSSTDTPLVNTTVNDLINNKTRLYFVRLKDRNLPEEPGSFELLGGTTLQAGTSSTTRWNVAFPVVPIVDARVAEVLAPNRKNCVENEVSCLGVRMDSRLPLEDELTDDGNGFENSWRHYLTLARQAADEAALLGREFRDAKLNKLQGAALTEQRLEERRQAASNALLEVQNICGTALDADKLLDYLSRGQLGAAVGARDKLDSLVVGGAPIDIAKLTPNDVKGSALDPDELKRFQDCIDDSPTAIEPFVTLGDKNLCVYYTGNTVCPEGTKCFGTSCPDLPNYSEAFAKPLKYFTTPTPPQVAEDTCRLFRILRGTRSEASLQELAAKDTFNRDRLRDKVGQLGFKAIFGGFFAITEDGSSRFTSGTPEVGRSAGWPWAGKASGCEAGGVGLFCEELGSTPLPRDIGALNARAFRAAYAAATLIDDGLDVTHPNGFDSGNTTPCNGKKYTTVYHKASVTGAISPDMPVWTCEARFDRSTADEDAINKGASYQPRGTGTITSWLLPDGTTWGSTALNMWGPGSPRCVPVASPPCFKGCLPNQPQFECFWDKFASTIPGPGFNRQQALQAAWAGLAAGTTYTTRGTIYELLKSTTPDYSTVLFEGGMPNTALSPGVLTEHKIWKGSGKANFQTNFRYYKVPLNLVDVLDGQELLCELDKRRAAGDVPSVLDLTSVDQAVETVEKFAAALEESGRRMIFANVPKVAAEALGEAGPVGAFPALSADMGEAVSGLRQGLVGTRHAVPAISDAVRSLAIEFRILRSQLEINETERAVIDYDTLSNTLNQITACASSLSVVDAMFKPGGVAATCINSVAQIAIGLQKNALQKQISAEQDNLARFAFVERMSQNITALEHASLSLLEASEQVNSSLARIDGLKKRAKLAIGRALYFKSYNSQTQAAYDASVGSLEDVAKKRFDQALKNAKLMSFFAKRAIEQRLGVKLAELREDYPLVQAPSLWEAETCEYGGFQDEQTAEPEVVNGSLVEPADGWVAKYGKGFIGDYVTKLENFVESYRSAENFHEGKDTAVISLRDDVANVRAACAQPARNLFKSSADMQAPAWQPQSCLSVTSGGVSVLGINCVAAVPLIDSTTKVPDLAVKGLAGQQDAAPGFKLQFGDGKDCVAGDAGGCSWQPGSSLGQTVSLAPGRYRLSWYTRDSASAGYTNGATSEIVILRPTNGLPTPTPVESLDSTATPRSPFIFPRSEGSGMNWKRASKEFTVTAQGEYEVGFGVPGSTRPTSIQTVTIGAPTLEFIRSDKPYLLAGFQGTDENGLATIATCEDTDGALFRLQHWKRECVRLCNTGYSAACQAGSEQCYRELKFGVSQSAIQQGKLFSYSGFAKGNFNYRIDTLGVNFVGSNIRNCTDASLPSTCYNAGFVPYSLAHDGPFFIRNHAGKDAEALLFDGRIEHARGLALERYFTSPIASTDRELITDYMRTEFSGRPLDGHFTLRVWEDQGIDFDSIQDVQLILNYRYWTAFD